MPKGASCHFNMASRFREGIAISPVSLFAARHADCSENGSTRISRGVEEIRARVRAHRTCPLHKATKWPRIRCHLAVRARRPTHGTATQTLRRYRGVEARIRDRAYGMSHFLAIADVSAWIPGRSFRRVLA